jgi:MoxR-like ATPase
MSRRRQEFGQTAYVGRRRERELLAVLIRAALAGRGQAVLLAGIGKTRLAEETAAMAAAAGMTCL